MVNYGNGKIYKIISDQTDKIYIGSTTKKYLSQRMDKHRSDYILFSQKQYGHYITAYEITKYDDAEIVLLESCPCKNKDELKQRERFYIEKNKGICVNKNIPGRGQKEYMKDYIEKNKRRIKNENKIRYKKRIPYYCDVCNCNIKCGIKTQHEKTLKHCNNMREYIPTKPLF
jgi:hypothetical protein